MLFHSIEFLFVFLPTTWIGFYLFVRGERLRGAVAWLMLASLVFYAWWNPPYVFLILGSIGCNYCVSRLLLSAARGDPRRPWILGAGLAANIGLLGYFKYANFFVDNLNVLFHAGFNLEKVILPLAISFFTFQQIVFLVAVYRGELRDYSLLEYAFAVAFFPHLIAGPIVRYHDLLPQIQRERWKPVRMENLQVGATIFVIGLFKKMVLADGCAGYATPIFDAASSGVVFTTVDAWVGTAAYSMQLYFDFSGYSDMAIGLARCFGILFPLNFNAPYKALSMIDFWRRWHITLSNFLRDHVYIPLGGSRKGPFLRYSNLMITMLIGGLWHGAGWTFVIWGGLHGVYLVINHGFRALTREFFARSALAGRLFAPLAWALTMLGVSVGWVFFRAENFQTASLLLASLFGLNGSVSELPGELATTLGGWTKFAWTGGVLAVALLAPTTHEYLRNYTPALGIGKSGKKQWLRWHPVFAHGVVIGVMLFLVFRRYFQLAPTEFLYFNF